MRQNEVRTTEHNHTSSSTAGGREATTGRRGADNSQTKDRHKETQPPTERRTTATERHPQTRRQKHHHNEYTTEKGPRTRGSETQDQGQKTAGRAQPNQDRTKPTDQIKQKGAQEGTEPHGGTQKDPYHTAASGSKSQCGAHKQRAQETNTAKARQQNRGKRRRKGTVATVRPNSV